MRNQKFNEVIKKSILLKLKSFKCTLFTVNILHIISECDMSYKAGYSYFNNNNCFHEKCFNCWQANENNASQ